MWGILGGGFGLYGYLPALLAAGETAVCLPRRYHATLRARPELRPLLAQVHFVDDDDEVLARVDGLVLAQRPQDAIQRLEQLVALPRLRQLVLEKPLGPTPAAAAHLLDCLEATGKTCRAGFTFRWAPWSRRWQHALREGKAARHTALRWHFRAHHYQHALPNWKRLPEQGGGALRFFGIHVVALLAEWGYRDAAASSLRLDATGGVAAWQAELIGPALPPLHIDVDSDAVMPCFSVGDPHRPLHASLDPFDEALGALPWPGLDRRCAHLAAMLGERFAEPAEAHARLHATNALWAAIEARTPQPSSRTARVACGAAIP